MTNSQLTRIINKKRILNHPIEETHTNIEASKIENALITLLVQAVDIIKDEYDDNPYLYNDVTVKKNVLAEVSDVFRSSTESFYKLGIDYVNRVNNTNPKFTIRDINNISTIANDSTNWTMLKLDAYFDRESKIQNEEDYIKPLKDYMNKVGGELITTAGSINVAKKLNSFDLEKNVKNIAVNTATRAIAMGTIDKARQMYNPSSASVVETKTAGPKLTIPQILTKSAAKLAELKLSTEQIWSAGFQPAEYVPRKQIERRLFRERDEYSHWGMWVTAKDDKVCIEYCVPLEGQLFDMLDEDSPIPGDLDHESHPNCRCRYLLADPEDILQSGVVWG